MYERQRAGSGLSAFPSTGLTPTVATFCLPFKEDVGNWQSSREEQNVIKDWKIRALRKGQKAVALFSFENKGSTDLKGHYKKDFGSFSSPQITEQERKKLALHWRRFWTVRIVNKEALKAHSGN